MREYCRSPEAWLIMAGAGQPCFRVYCPPVSPCGAEFVSLYPYICLHRDRRCGVQWAYYGVTLIGQLLSWGTPSLAPIRYREQGSPSSWIWSQYQQWRCAEFIKKRFNHFQVREQEDNQNSHPWGFHSRPCSPACRFCRTSINNASVRLP